MEPMIDASKNSFTLYQAIADAGYTYYGQFNNVHYVDDAAAVDAIVQAYDQIPELRAVKRRELKREAILRISTYLEWVKTLAEVTSERHLEVAQSLILMLQSVRPGLNEAALDADMQAAYANLDFVFNTALPWINDAARTVSDLKTLDIPNHPGWP